MVVVLPKTDMVVAYEACGQIKTDARCCIGGRLSQVSQTDKTTLCKPDYRIIYAMKVGNASIVAMVARGNAWDGLLTFFKCRSNLNEVFDLLLSQ